ncbi:MAG: DUF2207 domain-containing protein [Muribaculaceae bacterium]|nr:DUF2207 domain-containing protein [Muribaculaceae bacterium]
MNNKRYLSFVAIVVLAFSWARADRGGYTLRHTTIDAVVHENNKWDITETLVVDFDEPRHGIYKYVPSRFFYAVPDKDGGFIENVYKNIIKDVSVDGYNYSVEEDETKAENTIIKIGSGSSFVEGIQVYKIHYTIQYLDDRCSTEDFLCHTLWGDGWNTVADTLDFNVKFDKPLPANTKLNLYSGPRGSTENADSVAYTLNGSTITGHVTNLGANHAITISAKLPQGFWKAESKNKAMLYLMLLITIAAAVMYLRDIFKNKQRKPVRTVSFYPPEGMSSAEVGKIIDDSTDPEDLASLIPWFAHKGFITITEVPGEKGLFGQKTDLKLTKVCPLMPDAPSYQTRFMNAIFGSKSTVYLSLLGDRHVEMELATHALDSKFKGENQLTDITYGILWWLLMLVAAVGVYWTSHVTDMFNEDLALLGAFTGAGASLVIALVRGYGAYRRHIRSTAAKAIEHFICLALFGAAMFFSTQLFNEADLCYPIIYFYAGTAILCALSYMIDRSIIDTDYRIDLMGQLLGLRDFIKTAEHARLKMLVDENPQYFYDILPYAMVFGLSDKWSEQFKNIKFDNPSWYYSSRPETMMSPYMMSHAISSTVCHSIKDAVASASVDPTSSSSSGGFSGGGSSFSGGGGGGGGGGSW